MNTIKSVVVWLVLLLFLNTAMATTIRPFPNLGEMAKATEAVVLVKAIENYDYRIGEMTKFRTSFQVLNVVKGDLKIGEELFVQHYRQKIGDLERIVWGDLEVSPGKNYLLFLDYNNNGYWQPKMLSYAAFEEEERDGNKVLVPMGLGREVEVLPDENGNEAEALKVYKKNTLIELLERVVNNGASWNSEQVATEYEIASFGPGSTRAATNPGHCTHLSSAPHARWTNLDSSPLPVRYAVGGDASCSNEVSQINSAITAMNNAYDGIGLSNAGTHTFTPSCPPAPNEDGATGNEFLTWVQTNLGGTRHLIIQFDDPCSEIPDLVGCSGTLAFGGLYWSGSTYDWNGTTWKYAALGYVVVNNGTGACQCPGTAYEIMITHEMSHSLNVGHIASGNGPANMNPSCCNTVQTLDVECLDYMYLETILPVELVDFDGYKNQTSVELEWMTASEINNDHFLLERSDDGINYTTIAQIDGVGNSSIDQKYSYHDNQPRIGNNYYRLTQVDIDGRQEILDEVVKVSFDGDSYIQVVPNPVTNESFQLVYQSETEGEVEVEIFNIAGQRVYAQSYNAYKARNIVDLSHLRIDAGAYIIRTSKGNAVRSMKFVKSY
ncbi:MAG: T9SS type A sorting domain-containing protein [Saprospiraceae bacterium]|nr:T9SS type A sorting domain-containing protein [Saprospiraceae bacterium]